MIVCSIPEVAAIKFVIVLCDTVLSEGSNLLAKAISWLARFFDCCQDVLQFSTVDSIYVLLPCICSAIFYE